MRIQFHIGGPLRSSALLALALAFVTSYGAWADDGSSNPEELMEKSGCISCHRIDEKLIGPSFKQVAARYPHSEQTTDRLINAVRNGSEGVWGDVPMPPSTEQKLSDHDLRRIVDWLLQR
jgi:cytochrome c